MKKFLVGIAAAAIITIPMTSFALESMSKGALKKATGQAGVSIAIDDIVIYQKSNPTTIYWDADGNTQTRIVNSAPEAHTYGAAVKTGIEISYSAASEKVMVLDGILTDAVYGAGGNVMNSITGRNDIGIASSGQLAAMAGFDPATGQIDSAVQGAGYLNSISPLTIDVGTCESLSKGLSWNVGQNGLVAGDGTAPAASAIPQVAGVIIGLPTIEIQTFHKDNEKTIKLVTDVATANVVNADEEFISIEKTGHSTMAILGGRLEIAPH